ncbi:hypothetical protein JIN85_03990 [Luteolibacter pohnpeiensis]|uniref:Verru_Chthon cassette protein A n=1 Tax=Luteolibacter pohnpeiensis TaxID=454153 RepID=A0A934S8C8_9BACT|nr:hypothetical protein [Luteolibacter pohnpeiensis]MBK1881562.1 hypothetical protein [Luteolibacter pohnpeiensis]
MKNPIHFTPTKARKRRRRIARRMNGFALIAVMLMMVLLLVLGLGLMSLGAIGLKTTQNNDAQQIASANARLALAMAINELQTQLGDDRRITADASILGDGVGRPNLVGVWSSPGRPDVLDDTQASGPSYDQEKSSGFKKWLVSSEKMSDTEKEEYAKSAVVGDGIELFSEDLDGFSTMAEKVPLTDPEGKPKGSYAWAVSQAATKASIAIGTDEERVVENDAVVAPTRPNVGLSDIAQNPDSGWDTRAAKVLTVQQAALDPEYGLDRKSAARLAREHTTTSLGVLSSVTNGGLKTDMSLGFEMSDSDFEKTSWNNVTNPFALGGGSSNSTTETPLFTGVGTGSVQFVVNYNPVIRTYNLDAGAAPTFNALRSFYRIPHHMYKSDGTPTVFTREQTNPNYTVIDSPRGSETAINPILDRILLYVSFTLGDGDLRRGRPIKLVFTPVITLWNPYNVAIESEGFVAYPWMDEPFQFTCTLNKGGTVSTAGLDYISRSMGRGMGVGWVNSGHGRMAEPYYLCKMTSTGNDNGDVSDPIHFGPGEVRVFVPASSEIVTLPDPGNVALNKVDRNRSVFLKPVNSAAELKVQGGIGVDLTKLTGNGTASPPTISAATDTISFRTYFNRGSYFYFQTLEGAYRIKNPDVNSFEPGQTVALNIPPIEEVQIYKGTRTDENVYSSVVSGADLISGTPQIVSVIETFHRTAANSGDQSPSDIVYTVNPRQRYTNTMISGAQTLPNSHYDSSIASTRTIAGDVLQTTTNGRLSFYGLNNSSGGGRERLAFFEIPEEPMLSIAQFQNADFSDSSFITSYQVGNSWASPFIPIGSVSKLLKKTSSPDAQQIYPTGLSLYDIPYLMNAALWDDYYFSSIAPELSFSSRKGSPDVWDDEQSQTVKGIDSIVSDWLEDPVKNPLRNPRHILYRGGLTDEEIIDQLTSPEGCRYASSHILVDGSFNVNSTNVAAWEAVLASLRDSSLNVEDIENNSTSSKSFNGSTPMPRFRNPMGEADDLWTGYRELSDSDIKSLASEIVDEVRKRGPFLSLGEFVNRRLVSGDLGQKGALQAAIDNSGLNKQSSVSSFDPLGYPERSNIPEADTGVGLPGWLTQADLLNSLGPIMSVRSDTFTIRAYGEAKDKYGKVLARSWCEATVQRVPDWVDQSDPVWESPENVNEVNQTFGRKFEVVSFREIMNEELDNQIAKENS